MKKWRNNEWMREIGRENEKDLKRMFHRVWEKKIASSLIVILAKSAANHLTHSFSTTLLQPINFFRLLNRKNNKNNNKIYTQQRNCFCLWYAGRFLLCLVYFFVVVAFVVVISTVCCCCSSSISWAHNRLIYSPIFSNYNKFYSLCLRKNPCFSLRLGTSTITNAMQLIVSSIFILLLSSCDTANEGKKTTTT